MSLFPVTRVSLLGDTVNEFDRIFDNFFGAPAMASHSPSEKLMTNIPRANILTNKEGYLIEMAVPGFSRGDFNIVIEDNALTISVSTEDGAEYLSNLKRREFSYSSFTRSWTLPEGSSIENIVADYEAGILKVAIPAESANLISRQIEVR
jgi:HSP20 family protein